MEQILHLEAYWAGSDSHLEAYEPVTLARCSLRKPRHHGRSTLPVFPARARRLRSRAFGRDNVYDIKGSWVLGKGGVFDAGGGGVWPLGLAMLSVYYT